MLFISSSTSAGCFATRLWILELLIIVQALSYGSRRSQCKSRLAPSNFGLWKSTLVHRFYYTHMPKSFVPKFCGATAISPSSSLVLAPTLLLHVCVDLWTFIKRFVEGYQASPQILKLQSATKKATWPAWALMETSVLLLKVWICQDKPEIICPVSLCL